MSNKLMTLRHEDKMDFNLAQDKLVDFALDIVNNETKITEETLKDIVPAFFAYSTHIHESEGTVIDQIHYNTYHDEKNDVFAEAVRNELNLNTYGFEKSTPMRLVANYFMTMFHETQHISDNYNKLKKDTTNTSTHKYFYGSNYMCFVDYINHYEKANFFKISNPINIKMNQSELKDYVYKCYFFDNAEVDARARGFSSIYNLLGYAQSRPDIRADEKKFNQICGILQEVNHLNKIETSKANRIASAEISDELKQEFLDHLDLFYEETKEIIDQTISNPDKPLQIDEEKAKLYEKNNMGLDDHTITIDERLLYLSSSQNMFFNEKRANEIGELILLACESGISENHETFSYLITSSDFSPSENQMERIAKVYQYAHPEEDYPLKNSLSDFVSSFNTYSQSYLLPIYAKDNPDFMAQVENYESELHPLDMEIVNSIQNSNEIDTPDA